MNLTPQIMLAFGDELEKQGAPADLLRQGLGFLKSRAGTTGALGGAGAALGGLAGGGISGVKAYREARRAGATRGQAAMYGAGKGAKGAAKGALLGGGAGAALGLAGGARAAGLAEKITGKGIVGAPSRLAQRQVHSVTGYASPEQVKAMGAGSASAAKRATKAGESLEKVWAGGDTAALKKAVKEKTRSAAGLQAAEKAEQMGLTSLPGYGKSFVKDPLGTLKAGVGEQWRGSGIGGKAMMIGLPVGMAGLSAAPATQEGGPGRLERGIKGLASTAAIAAAPISGMLGMGMLERGASKAGGLVGAGGDVALRRRRKRRMGGLLPESRPGPEADESNAPHHQTIQSASAMGRAPEGMGM